MNIGTKFGSNWPSGFEFQGTDNRQKDIQWPTLHYAEN